MLQDELIFAPPIGKPLFGPDHTTFSSCDVNFNGEDDLSIQQDQIYKPINVLEKALVFKCAQMSAACYDIDKVEDFESKENGVLSEKFNFCRPGKFYSDSVKLSHIEGFELSGECDPKTGNCRKMKVNGKEEPSYGILDEDEELSLKEALEESKVKEKEAARSGSCAEMNRVNSLEEDQSNNNNRFALKRLSGSFKKMTDSTKKFFKSVTSDTTGFETAYGFMSILQIPIENSSSKRPIFCVAFRGTRTAKDFLNDINHTITDHGIFRGFYNRSHIYAWHIFKAIYDTKTDPNHPHYQENLQDIVFTGHSLGSADALIAPVVIATEKLEKFAEIMKKPKKEIEDFWNSLKIHYVGFGTPRCGTSNLVEKARNTLTFHRRFNNAGDVVATVPWEIYGFRHIDDGCQINASVGPAGDNLENPGTHHHDQICTIVKQKEKRVIMPSTGISIPVMPSLKEAKENLESHLASIKFEEGQHRTLERGVHGMDATYLLRLRIAFFGK